MEPEISEYEVSVTAIIEASSEEEAKKYFRRWLAAGSSRSPQVIAAWAARPRPTPEWVRVVPNTTPDDLNFGGWDILIAVSDGWSCVAETKDPVLRDTIVNVLHAVDHVLHTDKESK